MANSWAHRVDNFDTLFFVQSPHKNDGLSAVMEFNDQTSGRSATYLLGGFGKGKSCMPPEVIEAQLLLEEYRLALIDGLGSDGKEYKIACIPKFFGITNAGVAVRLKDQSAFLLIDGTGRCIPDYLPALLANEVTAFLQTRAVPVLAPKLRTSWHGQQRGPIVAYKFRLADFPSDLPF